MTIHVFGRTAGDLRDRQLWNLLAFATGPDAIPGATARYAVDRRGPVVTFSIPPSHPEGGALPPEERGTDTKSAERSGRGSGPLPKAPARSGSR